jgi:NACHT domain
MLTTRVIRVVLASPGDVKPEREAVPDLISELNRDVAPRFNVVLKLAMWETDARPGFHSDGPQALIDSSLKIKECDLLIGAFWKRFGTPTLDSQSGTEHEIRIAYEHWKKQGTPQLMIYFSARPWTPSTQEELNQMGKVLEFKTQFPSEGLWWSYKTIGEFTSLLRSHLTKFITELDAQPSTNAGSNTTVRPKPRGKRRSRKDLAALQKAEETAEFLQQYRERFSGLYSRWDLASVGVTQTGGATRPIEVKLDDIYLPLRLGSGYNPDIPGGGSVYSPVAVLARERPLVIRGAAGSGKTTWIRWTFRQLLRESEAFPITVELRKLARKWQTGPSGEERSLDRFLDDIIVEHVGSHWQGYLFRLLKDVYAPRPVLLVDGWDELGLFGEEFRGKLVGLMNSYPRLVVVVTSRPYGEGRPSSSDGFEVLDIQPLSDKDIEEFSRGFFRLCYAEDHESVQANTDAFMAALDRIPETKSLVRTALLLTMMLLISRSSPLPDKRHLLYQKCVENLLTALPDRRQEEGAEITRDQWRPTDVEERLRVTAAIAFSMQTAGGARYSRAAIVSSWLEVSSFLPSAWSGLNRHRFINWLVGPAGLLVDRSDGTLSFAHLSFQEYLTAWYLHSTIEGDAARISLCLSYVDNAGWWETLRLWAGLVGGQQPAKLNVVLQELLKATSSCICLVGCILADGGGTEDVFRQWIEATLPRLVQPWRKPVLETTRAWAASRQDLRKETIKKSITQESRDALWFDWVHLHEWARIVGIRGDIGLPAEGSPARTLVETEYGKIDSPMKVALGRVLSSSVSLWPGEPWELIALQCWPSRRRLTGHLLQALATNGFCSEDLEEFVKQQPYLLQPFPESVSLPEQWLGLSLVSLEEAVVRYVAPENIPEILSTYVLDWWLQLGPLLEILDQAWENSFRIGNLRQAFVGRKWVRENIKSWKRQFSSAILEKLPEDQERFHHCALALAGPLGILGLIGHCESDKTVKPLSMIVEACRIAMNPAKDPRAFKRELARFGDEGDVLWPALSRHLAFRGRKDDEDSLRSLAEDPSQRNGVLGWALKYLVRGDVVLNDGSEISLDELSKSSGVPPLPFIEQYPEKEFAFLRQVGSSSLQLSAVKLK